MTEGVKVEKSLWRLAFILVMGTFMAALDTTIVAVGVDTLVDEFDAPVSQIHWVSTGYLLAVVTAIPAAGWLADRFGGHRSWIGAVIVFVLASGLCAVAWSVPSLIAFRVLQGLAGGMLPPTGQALLARAAGPKKIGRILSVVAVVPLLSPVFGPLAGGAILSVTDWRWLFAVNLPIGAVVVVLALRFVPRVTPSAPDEPFDWRGALLLSPGLAVVTLGLTGFADADVVPPMLSAVAIAVGVGMLVLFVLHAMRHRGKPLIDPRLLVTSPIGTATLVTVIAGAANIGVVFLLPLAMQMGQGVSAGSAGLLLTAQGAGAAAGLILVNRTIDKLSPRVLVATGLLLVTVGTAVFTQLEHDPSEALIVVSLLVRGFGIAMIGPPVMSLVYSSVAPARVARAATVLNLSTMIGGSLGTAAFTLILQQRMSARTEVVDAFGDTFWCALTGSLVAVLFAVLLRRPVRAEEEQAPSGQR